MSPILQPLEPSGAVDDLLVPANATAGESTRAAWYYRVTPGLSCVKPSEHACSPPGLGRQRRSVRGSPHRPGHSVAVARKLPTAMRRRRLAGGRRRSRCRRRAIRGRCSRRCSVRATPQGARGRFLSETAAPRSREGAGEAAAGSRGRRRHASSSDYIDSLREIERRVKMACRRTCRAGAFPTRRSARRTI